MISAKGIPVDHIESIESSFDAAWISRVVLAASSTEEALEELKLLYPEFDVELPSAQDSGKKLERSSSHRRRIFSAWVRQVKSSVLERASR